MLFLQPARSFELSTMLFFSRSDEVSSMVDYFMNHVGMRRYSRHPVSFPPYFTNVKQLHMTARNWGINCGA
ncbi:hypothetical protein VTK56DRAFT_2659 [Thermocarpiscus australiensis]